MTGSNQRQTNRKGLYSIKIHTHTAHEQMRWHTQTHKHAWTNTIKDINANLNTYTDGHVCKRIHTRTQWPQTLLCQAPQKWERSSDERLEDNWWYFCAGASAIKRISHLLCQWARTVELRFGGRGYSFLKVVAGEATTHHNTSYSCFMNNQRVKALLESVKTAETYTYIFRIIAVSSHVKLSSFESKRTNDFWSITAEESINCALTFHCWNILLERDISFFYM